MLGGKPVRAFLLDVTGVLYNTSGNNSGIAIPGSIEAVERLYAESKVKFLSNESTATREGFHEKLTKLGFKLNVEDIITPAPVAAKYVQEHGLHPHLLVHDGVKPEFAHLPETKNSDCVIIGDAEENFTYDTLNDVFHILHGHPERPLLSLGNGKFYQRTDGPCLDVGGFVAGMIYATGCRHIELGKPAPTYFLKAVEALGVTPEEVVMIGDDIHGDVGGAQAVAMRGIQVKTGKWI
uniref:Phospholysine phosphohistidine inorganic pyrophosphate phosphatase n=1 Tax=Panagrellus redivivus TaxID=6233 RepID=A0A7E4W4E5_PANRE